jgi:phosphoribulokinase
VKRFLPSEYGSNTNDERVLEKVPILRAKRGTVEYLKSREDRISWSSVVTGLFFDWVSLPVPSWNNSPHVTWWSRFTDV